MILELILWIQLSWWMALEEEFDTEIPDEEAEKITTVQQAIDFVNSKKSVIHNHLIIQKNRLLMRRFF